MMHALLSDPGGVLIARPNAIRAAALRYLHNVGFCPVFRTYPNDHPVHDLGAQSHSLQSRSIRLRTPVIGFTRGFRY